MNFKETLAFLYGSLPMYQRVGGQAYKKSLDNILVFCAHLDNPHLKFKSVHIAGTNGKGSTAEMLSSIFDHAGYTVGTYTSPHLLRFTERIRINRSEIPESQVTEFVNRHKNFIDELKPSFFEMTVALAFNHFADQKVDIAVVETGLGGRLDSTNILSPLLSIITNIGLDHREFLGDTLSEIAGEKAGIIKDSIPVIIGEKHTETEQLFIKIAKERNTPFQFATDEIKINLISQEAHSLAVDVFNNNQLLYKSLKIGLGGLYQLKNLPAVLQSVDLLKQKGFTITEESLRNGLKDIQIKGRWQIIGTNPTVIRDTVHNEPGLREVLNQLLLTPHENLHIVWGTVRDKDIDALLQLLPKKAYYYFCEAKVPRALAATELYKKALHYNLSGKVIPDVKEALRSAKIAAGPDDLIFIGGSTFVAAEIDDSEST